MEGFYIHPLYPVKDGHPAGPDLLLEMVWASSELRYLHESFHKWSPTAVVLPQQCDLEEHICLSCSSSLSRLNVKTLLPCYRRAGTKFRSLQFQTFTEICGNGLNAWPQILISSPFTKFDWVSKLLFRKKSKYSFRTPAQLSSVLTSPLMYAKWSFWFKIISCNAKQCSRCCFCWLAVNQQDARLPPSEHLLYQKSISAVLAL